MSNRDQAKKLLKHYFRMGWRAAGFDWDSDNDSEVDTIVECLIDAAVEKMAETDSYSAEHKISGSAGY